MVVGYGRDGERERRTGARLTPQANGAVVVGGDVFDDREAEPGTRAAGGGGYMAVMVTLRV